MASNQKLLNKDMFTLWHDRLGHPGSIMMRKIIESSNVTSPKEPEDSFIKRHVMCRMLSWKINNSPISK